MNLLKCDSCGKIVEADKNYNIKLIKVYNPDDSGFELNCSQYFHICRDCLKKLFRKD